MPQVSLALLWHQHQPYYLDDVSGHNPMPWVRLHGTKDYWGMAMHLREVPEMRATINLVPSLLAQILAYTEQQHQDEHLRVSRLPADSLSEDDLLYLLDNFFMVNPEQMIRPYRRYFELYQQRGFAVDTAQRAVRRFAPRDVIDLQCWNNLVWIHPIAFELDQELAEFRRKGHGYNESEKLWLLGKQMELLGQVIPLHKELADRGQIELTTTPFYHPIMPLLCDKRLARQAMPQVVLPERLEAYAEDAAVQMQRAAEYHQRIFGTRPRGLWPSEGSVAQALVPLVAKSGFEWMATDEQILACSTGGAVSRDGQGNLGNANMLYRPWDVGERGHTLQVIFRDHVLSDQIGFHYQRYPAQQAVDDFIGRLEKIASDAAGQQPTSQFATGEPARPPLVSVILDGENCWEYYPGGGVEFLRTLYKTIVAHPKLTPVRVSDYLDQHPASDRLGQLFAGSWIKHDFGIWLGHSECNRAWDLVSQTRAYLAAVSQRKQKPPEQLARAWEELYIAEGSDWFWWFGDSHTSAQDEVFDQLFRKHLQNVYVALEEQVPAELLHPIRLAQSHVRYHTQPSGYLNVKVNGRQTYFEWLNAGLYEATGARGTMSMADKRLVKSLHFGFDAERLLLRLDTSEGPAREQLADVETLRVTFLEPAGFELVIAQPTSAQPVSQLYHCNVPVSQAEIEVAADRILEIGIPWQSLALAAGAEVQFFVELLVGSQSRERTPREAVIETFVPSADFELKMWQA
jgi:alpha-amylase/alpha-mannosidase (GH57 family)